MNVAIFSLIWTKNNFSAACVRTLGIIHSLLNNNCKIHYISPSKLSKADVSDLK